MSNRELKSDKRKQFRLWLSDEERHLLEVRAEQYGYRHLSEYLRDAGIYNDVIQIDISYTDSVNNLFQECINEIRKFTKEVRRVMKYDTSASSEEREMIQQALYRVYSQIKSLKKSVNNNINVSEVIKKSKVKLYKNEIKKEFDEIVNSSTDNEKLSFNTKAIISRLQTASRYKNENLDNDSQYNKGWQDCVSFISEIINETLDET